MHIPDGFINAGTSVAAGVVSAGGISVALKKAADTMEERQAPLAGLVAAFVFAVQMLNFPIAAGTSGHLLGGVLAGVLVGPWAGTICIALVLFVQGMFFADGGLSALGLNVFNMAIVGGLGGYAVFVAVRGVLPKTRPMIIAASSIAAFLSVVMASIGVLRRVRDRRSRSRLAQRRVRGDGRHPRADRDRGGRHHRTHRQRGARRPSGSRVRGSEPAAATRAQADRDPGGAVKNRKDLLLFVVGGLIVALGLAFFVSPYASSSPDGLNRVAIDKGFSETQQEHALADAPLAGYGVKGVDDQKLSTGLAGVIGVAVTFGIAMILFALLRTVRARRPARGAGP